MFAGRRCPALRGDQRVACCAHLPFASAGQLTSQSAKASHTGETSLWTHFGALLSAEEEIIIAPPDGPQSIRLFVCASVCPVNVFRTQRQSIIEGNRADTDTHTIYNFATIGPTRAPARSTPLTISAGQPKSSHRSCVWADINGLWPRACACTAFGITVSFGCAASPDQLCVSASRFLSGPTLFTGVVRSANR